MNRPLKQDLSNFYTSQYSNLANKITVLFNGSVQTGSLTLSDNIKNYDAIEINFGHTIQLLPNLDHNSTYNNFTLCCMGNDWTDTNNIGLIFSYLKCSINGTTLTIQDHARQFNYPNNSSWGHDKVVFGYITSVRGIKF